MEQGCCCLGTQTLIESRSSRKASGVKVLWSNAAPLFVFCCFGCLFVCGFVFGRSSASLGVLGRWALFGVGLQCGAFLEGLMF